MWSVSVKPCCGSQELRWGRLPTDPTPPIKCWQKWARNMRSFLLSASGEAIATRLKKKYQAPLTIPRMPRHPLSKRLKSSTSVFVRVQITEKSLNVEHAPPPSLHLLYVSTLSLVFPPSLRHPLHGCGCKCETLIKPWLLCFKRSCSKLQFPQCTQCESKVLDHRQTDFSSSRITEQSELSWNAAWELGHSLSTWHENSPALPAQKSDCLELKLSGKLCGRLWKRARWLSLQGILTSHRQHAMLTTAFK